MSRESVEIVSALTAANLGRSTYREETQAWTDCFASEALAVVGLSG